MQNLNNLNNLNALGIKGGGLFDPSSISVSGQKVLQQQLLTNRTPTIGGILYDERKNKGTARDIQLGRAYLFDGNNDYVACPAGLTLPLSGNTIRVKTRFNTTNLTNRTLFSQGGASGGWFFFFFGTKLFIYLRQSGSISTHRVFGTTTNISVSTNYEIDFTITTTSISGTINGVAETFTDSGPTGTYGDQAVACSIGSVAGTSFFFEGKIWGMELYKNSVLQAFYKMDEQAGTTAYDSSGNGYHGTITNATLATFHSTQNVYSYQDEVGYSKPASVFIPRNEAIPTQDVTGATLQYTGSVPYNGTLKQSNCIDLDGANDYGSALPISILTNASNPFTIKFRINFDTVSIVQRVFYQGLNTGTYRGSSIQLHSSGTLRFLLTVTNGSDQLSCSANGFTAVIGTEYDIEMRYTGNKLASGVTWIINGVTYTSSAITSTLTGNDLSGATEFRLGDELSGNRLNGKIWGFEILDGAGVPVFSVPISEGGDSISVDVAGTNNITWYNAPAWAKQNNYNYNIIYGFEYYDDNATHTSIIRVPYKLDGTKVTPTISGYSKIKNCDAGAYHNNAETLIDFTGNVLSPEAVRNSWETAWAFNTARTNPEFKRTLTSGGVDARADRFLAYRDALTGSNLSKVNKYVTTKII